MDRNLKKFLGGLLALLMASSARADQTIFQPTIFASGSSLTIQSGVTLKVNSGGTLDVTGATLIGFPSGGNVSNTGTPTANQLPIWTNATTIKGVTGLTGGSAGQVLKKNSVTDYDWGWSADSTGGGGVNSFGTITVAGQSDIIAEAAPDTLTITAGSNITLTTNATTDTLTIAATAGGTGDVVGPAGATDNAIARFDLATGKLIQNSVVTIADTTGVITGARFPNTGAMVEESGGGFGLGFTVGSNLTADRTLSFITGDASRTITMSANAVIGGAYSVASGKTFTSNNTLTLSGTDGSTLNIGAGGTLGTAAYTASSAYQPADGDLTSIAAAAGTNTIYYRSAADTWSPVTIGGNMTFSAGTLNSVAGGAGTVTTTGSPANGNMTKFSGATSITNAVAGTDYQAPLTTTTVGLNFLDLANPTAVRFPKITATNDVVAEDAATFRTSIGAFDPAANVVATSVFSNTSAVPAAPTFTSAPKFLKIGNLTTDGFVKTGSADGTLSVDTTQYLSTASAAALYQPGSAWLTDIAAMTPAQGDIMFFNGTDWVTLAAGSSGNQLTTHGAGANPTWDLSGGGGGGAGGAPVVYLQTTQTQTAGVSSTGYSMAGLAGTMTPVGTGKVVVTISGYCYNTTAGGGVILQIRHGTGAAPAHGAAPVGTAVGPIEWRVGAAYGASQAVPFSATTIISGLTAGTPIWLDAGYAIGAGGTGTAFLNAAITAVEVPAGTVDDTLPFGVAWNGVAGIAPSQNQTHDWGVKFDSDYDGKVDVLDQVAGIPLTNASGVLQTPIADNSGNWNTAFSDRMKWDGGATGLTAGTGRTSLGATTVGGNFFTLTNPSAITFPKINADNTVTVESAATFRTSIGAGTGNGTVTDFSAGDLSPLFTTSEATTGTTPALTFGLTNAAANTVFGRAAGTSGAPTYSSSPQFTAIGNLTTNGFVKTGGGVGTLSVDTSTYLTANQNISLTGDVTGGPAATSIATTYNNAVPAAKGGMLTGGTTDQVLAKNSATNYDLKWTTVTAGGNVSNSGTPTANQLPIWTSATAIKGVTGLTGGTTGQVLKKSSATDYDWTWTSDDTGAGGGVTSFNTRTGVVVAAQDDYTFAQLAAKPTTLIGYGITDAQPLDSDLTAWAGKTAYAGNVTVTTGKTLNATNSLTFSGTDASTLNIGGGGTLGTAAYTASTAYQAADADLTAWAAKTTYAGDLTITTGKTANITNSLTFSGTDASTLNIGTGGTLGTAAYTAATAYQGADADLTTWAGITPAANVGTFLATPNSANLRTAVTDETGTSGGLVFAGSPTITTPTIAALANLTTNGFVKTGGGIGTLSVDTASYQPLDTELTEFAAITPAQGDVIYYNGADWVKLAAGTDGNQLTTHSTGANPSWDAPGSGGGAPADPRVTSMASSATPAVDVDSYDAVSITALAVNITSMSSGITGSAANFQKLMYRIKDDGTSRTIAWGASFASSQSALPTKTTVGKVTTVGLVYDSVKATWECIAVDVEDASLATLQTAASAPTGTTSTHPTHVMAGLGAAGSVITPNMTGKIFVEFSGFLTNNTAGGGVVVQIRYGTGTAPANGAASTGTVIGTQAWRVGAAYGANQSAPFNLAALITGLTPGVAVWLDLGQAQSGGGTASINCSAAAFEIP